MPPSFNFHYSSTRKNTKNYIVEFVILYMGFTFHLHSPKIDVYLRLKFDYLRIFTVFN